MFAGTNIESVMHNNPSKIKAIIFDWGRTLHDPDIDSLFPGTQEVLEELSKKYTLALVTLAKSQSPEYRRKTIKESGIKPYFRAIVIGNEEKDKLYEEALKELALLPENVVVVDDRTIRGISWGNRSGAMTIWMRRGKFAEELPTIETGDPTHTITDLSALTRIL